MDRDSLGSKVTGHELYVRASVPDGGKDYFSSLRPDRLHCTQHPIEWMLQEFSPEKKVRSVEFYLHSRICLHGVLLN